MFVRTKIVSGLEYAYLVTNKRVGKKVKQKVVKYLGPVKPIYKKTKIETRKSNAWLFAQKSTEIDEKKLKKALNSPSAFTRDRARTILFSLEGKQCKQIAEIMGCDVKKVRTAIKTFNNEGLSCLKRGKAKGAKPKFTQEQRTEMLRIATTDPRKLSLPFTTWSLYKLKSYFIENSVVDYISHESVRTILKKQGFRIKKSSRFQYSNDPDFVKKNY